MAATSARGRGREGRIAGDVGAWSSEFGLPTGSGEVCWTSRSTALGPLKSPLESLVG